MKYLVFKRKIDFSDNAGVSDYVGTAELKSIAEKTFNATVKFDINQLTVTPSGTDLMFCIPVGIVDAAS